MLVKERKIFQVNFFFFFSLFFIIKDPYLKNNYLSFWSQHPNIIIAFLFTTNVILGYLCGFHRPITGESPIPPALCNRFHNLNHKIQKCILRYV